MPARSAAQFKAMQAAKNGKSALGIPKSVGEEYVAPEGTPDATGLPAKAPKKKSGMAAAMQKARGC